MKIISFIRFVYRSGIPLSIFGLGFFVRGSDWWLAAICAGAVILFKLVRQFLKRALTNAYYIGTGDCTEREEDDINRRL